MGLTYVCTWITLPPTSADPQSKTRILFPGISRPMCDRVRSGSTSLSYVHELPESGNSVSIRTITRFLGV
jgi:hypothetical protein